MMPRTHGKPGRLRAVDRRMAALHEAAHIVVARQCGITGAFAFLQPAVLEEEETLFDNKAWIGRTAMPLTELTAAGEAASAAIGVAGVVAEMAWKEDHSGLEDFYLEEEIARTPADPHSMSPTDWIMTGCEPGEPSDELIFQALRMHRTFEDPDGEGWRIVWAEANAMIDHWRVVWRMSRRDGQRLPPALTASP